jgi:Dockerin type I domain
MGRGPTRGSASGSHLVAAMVHRSIQRILLQRILLPLVVPLVPTGSLHAQLEHVMFITAINYTINPAAVAAPLGNSFGSLVAADQLCNARGQSPYMLSTFGQLTYKALLSDASTNARDRVAIEGRIINAGGKLLANDYDDLWDGTIVTGVNYNEFGTLAPNNTPFWTGSNQFGYSSQHAQNWSSTLSGQTANIGLSQSTFNWFNQATVPASQSLRLVAISNARVIDPGDFNDDGLVNAADYTVWRNSFGSTVERGYFADGDGNGMIDEADYAVWKLNFGRDYTLAGGGVASLGLVPEPSALILAAIFLATTGSAWSAARRRKT